MPPIDVVILATVAASLTGLVGVGLWCYHLLFAAGGGARVLRRVRARSIHDLPDGEVVKIVGRVRAVEAPLEAPLSGRPCVYWRVVLQEYRHVYGPGPCWSPHPNGGCTSPTTRAR